MPSEKSSSSAAAAAAAAAVTSGDDGGGSRSNSSKEKGDRKREKDRSKDDPDKAKTHKLSLKGSSKLVAEFFEYSINTILFQRGVYPPEDFTAVKKYGLNMLVTSDAQIKAYIRKIMSQLNKWMIGGKISKLVIVITDKETGEHVERWQFDVDILSSPASKSSKSGSSSKGKSGADGDGQGKENAAGTSEEPPSEEEIQTAIRALFRQITASVTFLPALTASAYTFNVLVYADADSEVPLEWGDSDAKEIENAEKVVLRSFSTGGHRVGTVVSYRLEE